MALLAPSPIWPFLYPRQEKMIHKGPEAYQPCRKKEVMVGGVSVPSSFLGKPRWHGDGIGMVLRMRS